MKSREIGTFFILINMNKVAIQGIKGSFHHQAATQYFENHLELQECMTFAEIPKLLQQNKVTSAVMAIENSIAGSILPNYKLIDEFELTIVGEVFLTIQHQLLALPGQSIGDITEVHSHPMALQQCEAFFENHPHIVLIESKDTAESALQIAHLKKPKVGAIASTMAGTLYGLETIAADIHTYKNNTTRFFVVQMGHQLTEIIPNKASLKLTLSHEVGSLLKVLQLFADNGINLSKIQSLPLRHTPFQYAFFIDVEFDDYHVYLNCLSTIKLITTAVKILGEYIKSQ
ncbi:MAG: prephenate dehydratase [Flavobacteriaceae bacterium]|nr:prephenate dehydratase [Flavobacteriaceae bacterium]